MAQRFSLVGIQTWQSSRVSTSPVTLISYPAQIRFRYRCRRSGRRETSVGVFTRINSVKSLSPFVRLSFLTTFVMPRTFTAVARAQSTYLQESQGLNQ